MKNFTLLLFLSFFGLTISCHSDTSTEHKEKTEVKAYEITWENKFQSRTHIWKYKTMVQFRNGKIQGLGKDTYSKHNGSNGL